MKTKIDMDSKKKVLILVNHEVVIYNFRLELVERLLTDGYEVHISTPVGERVWKLKKLGTIIHPISFERHGMNPARELSILWEYNSLIQEINPVIILAYTIKPNIYGALASNRNKVPFVANITGLGMAVNNSGIQQKLIILMYRIAFGTKRGRIQRVFFQNEENRKFFKDKCIALDKHGILPGSGVNLERFPFMNYPECGNGISGPPVKFAFISRIMAEKGIDEYLTAAERIKKEYPNTEFHICGFFEMEYDRNRLDKLHKKGTVIFHGNIDDVSGFMSQMHCIVHPTYYPEGLSNVLLEAGSTGRPIITTDRPGCREVIDGNGFLIDEQNAEQLISAIEKFIKLPNVEKQMKAKRGRELVEEKFDRQIIVDAYINEIRHAEQKVNR